MLDRESLNKNVKRDHCVSYRCKTVNNFSTSARQNSKIYRTADTSFSAIAKKWRLFLIDLTTRNKFQRPENKTQYKQTARDKGNPQTRRCYYSVNEDLLRFSYTFPFLI